MPHAKGNFRGSQCGRWPVNKQLEFDERVIQDATFGARNVVAAWPHTPPPTRGMQQRYETGV